MQKKNKLAKQQYMSAHKMYTMLVQFKSSSDTRPAATISKLESSDQWLDNRSS